MKVKKGEMLRVEHTRKGTFNGTALEDFDTETDEWYPIAARTFRLEGATNVWDVGDRVPCRNSFTTVHKVYDEPLDLDPKKQVTSFTPIRMQKVIQHMTNQIAYLKELRYHMPTLADGSDVIPREDMGQYIANAEDALEHFKKAIPK